MAVSSVLFFVGDPQIGSSNELKGAATEEFYNAQSAAVANDAFNWNTTLNQAMEKTGNKASFVLSSGDQIQSTKKSLRIRQRGEVKSNTVDI